ncbi:hypothetical protein [uncultured Proteiniphilum sp.]|uniref:hypothetical protein n=1 Tax=uncultured Proteiniphilum sp. TaxID=497637 RepID=UPI00261FFAA1|nr:hypothetical protein [uncultured Proteiniphilum sp.]
MLGTALTGRYLQITMLPFSFAELTDFKNLPLQSETPADELKGNNLLMITHDEERTIERNGRQIQVVPVWKWVLQGNNR